MSTNKFLLSIRRAEVSFNGISSQLETASSMRVSLISILLITPKGNSITMKS
jgi:hypothetical protein